MAMDQQEILRITSRCENVINLSLMIHYLGLEDVPLTQIVESFFRVLPRTIKKLHLVNHHSDCSLFYALTPSLTSEEVLPSLQHIVVDIQTMLSTEEDLFNHSLPAVCRTRSVELSVLIRGKAMKEGERRGERIIEDFMDG